MASSKQPKAESSKVHDLNASEAASVDTQLSAPGDLGAGEDHRIYNVYNTTSFTNYRISQSNDKSTLYYVRTSIFTPGKPEITFHVGERGGSIVGIANFLKFSSHSKIGLGDPADTVNMVWEDFKKESVDHSKYRFEMTVKGERKGFLWKRTRSIGVEGSVPNKFSESNFKLLDEGTGELLGIYSTNGIKSIRKMGKFQLNRNYGPEFDLMFLLTGMALLEKLQRRKHARGSGGGGGGGG
ncbi:hypothetical protein McanMca71_007401 [Microsporum canis]|uniref:Tubby C-terminal-like domain-containing protein n=1 Tax=Arthroderma otae (strain ATCC MYA-4605 / CBS 113480) TaxID=554155 RepID=C5FJF4_ARTOC|nr:conserved hypothetical protein [Microsporum canis CBS 113480]EEQ29575.1 conserved hypothetical protein [Microsporum canis CBS 113480]